VFRAFAHRHREVRLVELGPFVCPTHTRCREKLRGVVLRPDGTHYRGEAARMMARWLLPQMGLPAGP